MKKGHKSRMTPVSKKFKTNQSTLLNMAQRSKARRVHGGFTAGYRTRGRKRS